MVQSVAGWLAPGSLPLLLVPFGPPFFLTARYEPLAEANSHERLHITRAVIESGLGRSALSPQVGRIFVA